MIWKPIVFLVGLGFIIALIVAWIFSLIGFFYSLPNWSYLAFEPSTVAYLGIFNITAVLLLPAVFIIFYLGRVLFKVRYFADYRPKLLGVWGVNLLCLLIIVFFIFREFHQAGSRKEVVNLPVMGDTIVLQQMSSGYHGDSFFWLDQVHIQGGRIYSTDVYLSIEKSNSDRLELEKHYKAYGPSTEEANDLIDQFHYDLGFKDNIIRLPGGFLVEGEQKWRQQEVNVVLKVPEGKVVRLEGNHLNHLIRTMGPDRENRQYYRYENGQEWRMGAAGNICLSCNEARFFTHQFPIKKEGFDQLRLEGPFKVRVFPSDTLSITYVGEKRFLEQIDAVQLSSAYTIELEEYSFDPVGELSIGMPDLQKISVENVEGLRIEGFDQEQMELISEGDRRFKVKAFIEIDSLTIRQSGRSTIDLRGNGEVLELFTEERARLDAENYDVDHAKVTANDFSEVKLYARSNVVQKQHQRAKVSVSGNASISRVEAEQ